MTDKICDMCGVHFESWEPPDLVCRPCVDHFVKFIDDTILEELADWTQDGEGDGMAP